MMLRLTLLFIFFVATGQTFAQHPSLNGELAKQNTASKQVSTFNIETPLLNTTKKIWIYLPKNYKTSQKKYPVMYMHDGQNLFDAKTSFVGEWNVDEN
jgi:enterochelin esterase-like enzyme